MEYKFLEINTCFIMATKVYYYYYSGDRNTTVLTLQSLPIVRTSL